MVQARMQFQADGGVWCQCDLICPTTVIDSTAAEYVLDALIERLPIMFSFDANVRYVLIMNCDSASSNGRLAGHMRALTETKPFCFLHSRCMMHMACASVVAELKTLDMTTSAFCATLQLHDGQRMDSLRRAVRAYIFANVKVCYEQPADWAVQRRLNSEVVSLVLSGHSNPDDVTEDNPTKRATRRKAGQDLLDLLPGDWSQPAPLIHWCRFGCCDSPEDAAEKIWAAFDQLLLCCRPRIPSLNRWTRLYQPLAWWCVACRVHGIVRECMVNMRAPDAPKTDVTTMTAWSAPDESDVHRAKKMSRWQKASAWLSDPLTEVKLNLGVSLMRPALDVMSHIFKYDGKPLNVSALDFAPWACSPAARTIRKYSELLCDESDPFWLVISNGEWTAERRQMALHGSLSLMGHIYLRMVMPFQAWPWPLAEMASEKVPEARRSANGDSLRQNSISWLLSENVCENLKFPTPTISTTNELQQMNCNLEAPLQAPSSKIPCIN